MDESSRGLGRFLFRILSAPVRFLVWVFDLDDGGSKGRPSFSKIVTLAVAVTAVTGMWRMPWRELSAVHVTLVVFVLSAAMGRSMFRMALLRWESKADLKAAAQYSRTEVVTEIRKERDPEAGVDPA